MAKQTVKVTNVEPAQAILDELIAKRESLAASRANDEATMAAVSYEAHTGNEKAAAKLETLRDRAIRRDLEVKNLESAIAEAQRRVAAAQEAEARAEERRVAGELAELATMLGEAGNKCDRALRQLIEGSSDLRKIVGAINQRGCNSPSAMQLQSLGSRAILGELVNTPFAKAFEHIAPRERQNFAAFTSAWANSIERSVSHKLKGSSENAA